MAKTPRSTLESVPVAEMTGAVEVAAAALPPVAEFCIVISFTAVAIGSRINISSFCPGSFMNTIPTSASVLPRTALLEVVAFWTKI